MGKYNDISPIIQPPPPQDARYRWERFAFHPNDNRATVIVDREAFVRYLSIVGNGHEYLALY